MDKEKIKWLPFAPRFIDEGTGQAWVAWVPAIGALSVVKARGRRARVKEALAQALAASRALSPRDRARFIAAAHVACDLARQGWRIRFDEDRLSFATPLRLGELGEEKKRVRRQLAMGRDEQLCGEAVQKFLRKMETRRHYHGEPISITSLMRDGPKLAEVLRRARSLPDPTARQQALRAVIQPYLQEVREGDRCPHTGLALRDIWRYFRHTWVTPYRSTPGRNLDLLIRDAAAPHHPVIGIASIISSAAQIRIRDREIGWDPASVLQSIQEEPTLEWARWLRETWRRSWDEVFIIDFLEDGLFTIADVQRPTKPLLSKLLEYSKARRREHERFAKGSHHKGVLPVNDDGEPDWEQRARTALYKSKRALRVSELLRAQMAIEALLRAPTVQALGSVAATAEGRWAIKHLARRSKADKMGVAIADIGVCGAIAPYTHVLGGKLVTMLMMSPELHAVYDRKYRDAHSVIASSNAGRPIVRGTDLALLMTTSLYGAGSSQYNRVRLPCERAGGPPTERVIYERLGLTDGYGTSQFSDETVEALALVVSQELDGQRNNSFFGEGSSPRLRKVREGLDRLELDSATILKHGSPKVVYAISLARNLRRFLLGLDESPDYLLPQDDPIRRTREIASWWCARWLSMRVEKDEILARVQRESLLEFGHHGARIQRVSPGGQLALL